jgi:hypothetical protein
MSHFSNTLVVLVIFLAVLFTAVLGQQLQASAQSDLQPNRHPISLGAAFTTSSVLVPMAYLPAAFKGASPVPFYRFLPLILATH